MLVISINVQTYNIIANRVFIFYNTITLINLGEKEKRERKIYSRENKDKSNIGSFLRSIASFASKINNSPVTEIKVPSNR